MKISTLRSYDAFWWLLGGGLGLLVPLVAAVLTLSFSYRMTREPSVPFLLLVQPVGFFASGALMGALRPERPWRWAVAAVVPGVVMSFVVSVLPKSRTGIPGDVFTFALMGLPSLVLLSLTALAETYLAAFARTRGRPASAPALVVHSRDLGARSRLATSLIWTLVWSAVLGSLGFAAGFFGPMISQPDNNLGPLLGIFVTGPLGAVLGLILGAVFSGVRTWKPREMALLIAVSCVLYVGWILLPTGSSSLWWIFGRLFAGST